MPNTYCLKDFQEWLKREQTNALCATMSFANKGNNEMSAYSQGYWVALDAVLEELDKLKKKED